MRKRSCASANSNSSTCSGGSCSPPGSGGGRGWRRRLTSADASGRRRPNQSAVSAPAAIPSHWPTAQRRASMRPTCTNVGSAPMVIPPRRTFSGSSETSSSSTRLGLPSRAAHLALEPHAQPRRPGTASPATTPPRRRRSAPHTRGQAASSVRRQPTQFPIQTQCGGRSGGACVHALEARPKNPPAPPHAG